MRLLLLLTISLPIWAQGELPKPSSFLNMAAGAPRLGMPEAMPKRIAGQTMYRWSVAAVVAANAADVASSWRGREANPLVAGPNAQFGLTSVAIKSGFVGASLLIQHTVLRHRPDLTKRLAWMNFGTAGVLGGVATRNTGVH
jgi:hypothetical protein